MFILQPIRLYVRGIAEWFVLLLFVLYKITVLGLCSHRRKYFRFNDFYIWFISASLARCLKEEGAKSTRANVGGLYLFGWMFLQMLGVLVSSVVFLEIPGYRQLKSYDLLFIYWPCWVFVAARLFVGAIL